MHQNEKYLLEVFPWVIPEEFILSSIKNELNALSYSHSTYTIHYMLSKEQDIPCIRQYIEASDSTWQSFLVNFYSKLYQQNISFIEKDSIPFSGIDWWYSIWLSSHYVFQIKKPWEIGLNTFSSSSGIIENMMNEFSSLLHSGESIYFKFQFKPTIYSPFVKDILYSWKERNMGEEWKLELESSFTEKLDFFLFDFHIQNNLDNQEVFQEILAKNLWIYEGKWNRYMYSYNEKYIPTLPDRYRKSQVDQFLGHWLITLISSQNSAINGNFSKIIPVWQNILNNNGIVSWDEVIQPAILWKWYIGLIQNQKKYVALDKEKIKNPHSLILWATWSGKSFSTSQFLWFEWVKTIEEDIHREVKSTQMTIDPHNSLSRGIYTVLGTFNTEKNYKYQSNFEVKEFSREWISQDSRIYNLPLQHIELSFNPLDMGIISQKDERNLIKNIQKTSIACLEGIKGVYNDSSFWAQNEDIIGTWIKLFVLLNYLRRKTEESEEYKGLYTLWDLHDLLVYIEQKWGVSPDIKAGLANALTHVNPVIQNLADQLKNKIQFFINQLQGSKNYLSSSINKLSEFAYSLSKSFWKWVYYKAYTLNLEDLYLINQIKTQILLFNLWDYENTEKNIIASFLLSYSYFFASQKNHLNPIKLARHTIVLDEASSLLNGGNIIQILWKCLAEMRKYGVSYSFMMQSIDQKGFQEIYPNVWFILLFSVDMRQWNMIKEDINSGISGAFINASDVINNKLGSFYAFFKFKEWGNSTILVEWLSMNLDEITTLIS